MASKITLHVKSIYTGEKNEISVDKSNITICMDSTDSSLVQNSNVAPTQNYSEIDTNFVNRNANKGANV